MPRAKPKTTHNDVTVIKQLVNFAVRRRMIRENQLADLKLPQPKRTPQPFWRRDQVEMILKAANTKYRALFHFLADTGTRIGEARWLTWNDVNLEDKVIHIRAKEGWQPKTGDERVIHLSAELREVLTQLPRNSEWVFTAPQTVRHRTAGRQVSDRRALAHLKTVLKKIGLPGHLHTFRHAFVSHMLTSGVAESIVREWVGHIDPEIMRIYTHVANQQSRAAMDHSLPGHLPPKRVEGDQD